MLQDEDSQSIALMQQIVHGDEKAFADLVRLHQKNLLNYFLRMGATITDAEDLVQETFLRLYRWRENYQPSGRFSGFLVTLARNAFIDSRRKQKRSPAIGGSELTELSVVSDAQARSVEKNMDIQAALADLSDKLREVVILNIYEGLNYKEIADILSIPEGTVKSRMFLAIRQMRGFLGEENADG